MHNSQQVCLRGYDHHTKIEDFINVKDSSIVAMDFWIAHAMEIIQSTYGDVVSVHDKNKDLLKFGETDQVQIGTKTTIMTLPTGTYNETYVAANSITTISSDNTGDTVELVIEGHTIDGSGNFTFVSQTATLNGQNQVTLTTPLARCTRMYNNNSTDLVGTVYSYENDTSTAGVPDTDSKVHAMIPAGENQTLKCSTTISNVDYWIVKNFGASTLKKAAGFCNFTLEIREKGKVFRPVVTIAAASGNTADHVFEPYLIVPKNSDVRVRAISDANNTEASAHVDGVLALVIG